MSDTETRPLRADALRNRQRLLDAARAAFAEHGTDASLEDVARRATVGIGTLYRHFPHRDDLVEALVRGEVDGLGTLSAELAEGDGDPLDALHTWLRALVRHTLAFRGLAEQLVTAAGSDNRLGSACHDTEAAGRALFDRAQSAGLVRPDARIEDAIDLATSIAWVVERSGRDDPDHLLTLALDGLRPRLGPGQGRAGRSS